MRLCNRTFSHCRPNSSHEVIRISLVEKENKWGLNAQLKFKKSWFNNTHQTRPAQPLGRLDSEENHELEFSNGKSSMCCCNELTPPVKWKPSLFFS